MTNGRALPSSKPGITWQHTASNKQIQLLILQTPNRPLAPIVARERYMKKDQGRKGMMIKKWTSHGNLFTAVWFSEIRISIHGQTLHASNASYICRIAMLPQYEQSLQLTAMTDQNALGRKEQFAGGTHAKV